MALVNRDGRGISSAPALKRLIEKPGDPGTAIFSGMMTIDPGQYRLILSMADSEGRVGSVSRGVTAWQMDATALTMGDLLIGGMSAHAKGGLEPAIEPTIATGQMAALMEAYGSQLAGLDGTLEIITDENSAPLATMPLRVGAGASPEIATLSAQVSTTALPPGRYLARGTIRQGGKPQGHLVRPFRIVAANTSTDAAAVPSAGGALPADVTKVLLSGLSPFDRKELLAPGVLAAMYAVAESRPAGSKAAIKEAKAGDLGGAAMTALGENDQALATFLKGLELYQQSQLDRAAVQFQSSMQMAPSFTPSRLYLGAALAEGNRHREAAGLLQGAAGTAPPNFAIARLAGEEWLKAGQPALAIAPLELALKSPTADPRARKLLGVAYVLGGRPADAVATLTPYLETAPTDPAALIAAIFGTYIRHLNAPQAATLAADRANVAKWSKAYAGAKGPMQPLVAAWVAHLQGLK
jgi:Flp pilus assembly protein TadD